MSRAVQRCPAADRFQETDKATIDVEAQDEGILGKIIVYSLALDRATAFTRTLSSFLMGRKTSP
jgi:hypothetical protein